MTTMADGSRLTMSQRVAIARRNLTAASSRSKTSSSWSTQRISGTRSTAHISSPRRWMIRLRRVGVGARDDPAQQPAVVVGQVLAAEILEHARLDPRVVALEIEEGLHEIDVDRIESVVEEDPVGHVGDQLVEARLIQAALAELVQPARGGRRARTRPGRSRAASAPWPRTGTRRTACRASRSRLLSTYRPYWPVNAVIWR